MILRTKLKSKKHILDLKEAEIIDVWQENMELEMHKIKMLILNYPIIAFDTEFPGFPFQNSKSLHKQVLSSISGGLSLPQDNYKLLKDNVNQLKLIQIGFCLCDVMGRVPEKGLIWQFNFQFDIDKELFDPLSIQMLQDAGINFQKLKTNGCDRLKFSEMVFKSGNLCNLLFEI